jgi:hypothetical protein
MHSACHEEGDEQLAVERVGRKRTANEEVSSKTKTKKSVMQRASSAASLVGSMRDAAREQEGDDAVKPKKRKVRTEPPDDGSKKSTSINDVVRQIDAQRAREDLADGRGNTVEAGKQGRPPDNSLHEPQELFAEKHLEVRGVGVIEDNELRRQNLKKRDVHHIDARHVEGSKSAASPVGRGRKGEGRAVEGSNRTFPGREDIYAFGQPKHSGIEREVAKLGHLEKSVEEKGELWPGEPRHNSGIGKGDTFASSWVQEGLQNNESRCYSINKVSKEKEAHTVPPRVVHTSHSPSNTTPTRSKTHIDPPCGHQTAAPSAQPRPVEGSCLRSWNCFITTRLTTGVRRRTPRMERN